MRLLALSIIAATAGKSVDTCAGESCSRQLGWPAIDAMFDMDPGNINWHEVLQVARATSQESTDAVLVTSFRILTKVAEQMSRATDERERLLKASPSSQALEMSETLKPMFDSVERRANLSFAEFWQSYAQKRRPVFITDAAYTMLPVSFAEAWERVASACGDMSVRVGKAKGNLQDFAGIAMDGEDIPLRKFMKRVLSGRASASEYVFDENLNPHCPKLLQELRNPKYFVNDFAKRSIYDLIASGHPSLFVGANGSHSTLHIDKGGTHFWQLVLQGEKRWTVWPFTQHQQRTLMYLDEYIRHREPEDPEAEGRPRFIESSFRFKGKLDFDNFPALRWAAEKRIEFTMSAGDLLYLPAFTPHSVVNIGKTLAISNNFVDKANVKRMTTSIQDEIDLNAATVPLDAQQGVAEMLEDFKELGRTGMVTKPEAATFAEILERDSWRELMAAKAARQKTKKR